MERRNMKAAHTPRLIVAALAGTLTIASAHAQNIPAFITTPDKVETSIGTLEFKDGAPSAATVQKVRDSVDFVRGVDAFMNSFSGASAYAIRKGFQSIGAEDNTVRHLLRADGLELAFSYRQCRHHLYGRDPRPDEGAAGGRGAAGGARHDQRHVVRLDHRHRFSRPGPRRRGQVSDRAAGLRGPASGERFPRRPLEDHACPLRRSRVHGQQRSQTQRRS